MPRGLHVAGPNSSIKDTYSTVTLEVEQNIGRNLHLLLSGNFYDRITDNYGTAAARNIFRDLSPTLPNGSANPNFNQLYTEYFRTESYSGNIVRVEGVIDNVDGKLVSHMTGFAEIKGESRPVVSLLGRRILRWVRVRFLI